MQITCVLQILLESKYLLHLSFIVIDLDELLYSTIRRKLCRCHGMSGNLFFLFQY